ncbi:hypothetical protein GQ55_5G437300 [Panicum hallii var. hallii]|uniref:Uncharacterized protein n=1 Tax=Panicum hallii var. hallii TaxID=1504633 RepID=A0A2T7DPL2_9POAL|nr:hypothetical protein GQ55_5G437300 [Panicum hallii var. hallii]
MPAGPLLHQVPARLLLPLPLLRLPPQPHQLGVNMVVRVDLDAGGRPVFPTHTTGGRRIPRPMAEDYTSRLARDAFCGSASTAARPSAPAPARNTTTAPRASPAPSSASRSAAAGPACAARAPSGGRRTWTWRSATRCTPARTSAGGTTSCSRW